MYVHSVIGSLSDFISARMPYTCFPMHCVLVYTILVKLIVQWLVRAS